MSEIAVSYHADSIRHFSERPLVIARVLHIIVRGACCAALFLCAGCGTGEYERRYEEQLKQVSAESPYVALYGPLSVPATGGKDVADPPQPFSIRLPRVFAASYQLNSVHDEDVLKDANGKEVKDLKDNVVKLISMYRLQPPMLVPDEGRPMTSDDGLPGFWRCYEGKFTSTRDRREYPYYCYLACGEADKAFPNRLGMVRARVAQVLPETSKTWLDCDISANGQVSEHAASDPKLDAWFPDGRAQTCKRIIAKGQQDFFDRNNGQRLTAKEPGTLELYLFQANGYFLIVGWRYPDAVEKEFATPMKIGALSTLPVSTVRSLQVAAPKESASDAKGAKK